jgi:argininosuccinate lyase
VGLSVTDWAMERVMSAWHEMTPDRRVTWQVIAIDAAWYGSSWKAATLTEEEEQTISLGMKNITTSMQERSCIFQGEMDGLKQINSVREKHGSGHRVVAWFLPRFCDER